MVYSDTQQYIKASKEQFSKVEYLTEEKEENQDEEYMV